SAPSSDFGFSGFDGQAVSTGPQEPEIRIAIQETSNRLFVLATQYQLLDIDQIIQEVDVELEDALGALQIYELNNQEPADVKDMLERLFDTEREVQGVDSVTYVPGKIGAPSVVELEQSHAVAVRASQRDHELIASLLETLDKRPAQVLVEAILVQVSASESLKLGINLNQSWDVGGLRSAARTISGVSPFGFGAALGGNNLVTGEGGTIAFFDDELVFATLEAFADQTDTKIVSKPRILVNNNESGSIVSQRQEPKTKFTIAGAGNTTTPVVEFAGYESAGTTLDIIPHIGEDNSLKLEISLTVDSFEGKGSGTIPPPKTNNAVTTIVTVPDGMTMILGGLTSQNDGLTVNKVPLLGDIPVLGALFRSVSRSELEGVLYVFIRAEIVNEPDFSDLDDISELYRNKLRESEMEHQNQSSIIPGLKDKNRVRPSALDEFNRRVRDLNIDDKDKNSANQNLNHNGVNLSYNRQFGKDK
ncbi:MAG: hypothetical protein GY869_04295, partial [Planctomycetes bacterium]|nr:hypothetical protein [Planctomycetota bacterium]